MLAVLSTAGFAKLPAASDEAKAKAAEAAAKTGWSGKMDAYLTCSSQDKVAAKYYKSAQAAGRQVKPAAAMAPCANPGAFDYTPAVAASVPTPAPSAVPVAVPAQKS